MTTLLSTIDTLFGRDFVTGSLAIGAIAALIGAIYLAKGEPQDTDPTE